jgi:hypothetical protein
MCDAVDITLDTQGGNVSRIVKLWAGIGNELFTNAHSFEVEPPLGASAETKARLLAATFCMTFFKFLFF